MYYVCSIYQYVYMHVIMANTLPFSYSFWICLTEILHFMDTKEHISIWKRSNYDLTWLLTGLVVNAKLCRWIWVIILLFIIDCLELTWCIFPEPHQWYIVRKKWPNYILKTYMMCEGILDHALNITPIIRPYLKTKYF